jgi:hypothetical protein
MSYIPHRTRNVGDYVYIVDVDGYLRHATVRRQEWWSSNATHPVYYDVGDDEDPNIAMSTAPNAHFSEVFDTAAEAIRNYNIFSTKKVSKKKVK